MNVLTSISVRPDMMRRRRARVHLLRDYDVLGAAAMWARYTSCTPDLMMMHNRPLVEGSREDRNAGNFTGSCGKFTCYEAGPEPRGAGIRRKAAQTEPEKLTRRTCPIGNGIYVSGPTPPCLNGFPFSIS
jgi:hypothetical protein